MARGQNVRYFEVYFDWLFNLAVNMFIWEGMPDTCDTLFLEKQLCQNYQCLMGRDEGELFMYATKGGGGLSLNGWPTEAWGWGFNGTNKQFTPYVPFVDKGLAKFPPASGYVPDGRPDAVIIYDNKTQYPFIISLVQSARRLADLRRSEDVAVKALKSPVLITVPQEQFASAMETMEMVGDNMYAIIKADEMDENKVKVFQTGANPASITAIADSADREESRILARIGIGSNRNEDKKERMTTSEVRSLDQLIMANLDTRLKMRELACDWISDCFGVKPTVKLNEEVVRDVERLSDAGDVLSDNAAGGAVRGQRDTAGSSANNLS